jgi:hypothetical protein
MRPASLLEIFDKHDRAEVEEQRLLVLSGTEAFCHLRAPWALPNAAKRSVMPLVLP